MARVAFFTEKLPPAGDPIAAFSYELMRALAEQQHEVRIFSTYREDETLPSPHPRLEILRPFRKWSWLELPRLLPVLLDFRPQIFHFIQPRAEALEGFTNAMSAIPGLAPVMGNPIVITSLFDVRESSLMSQKLLLQASDLVTVTNRPQKESVETFVAQLGRQKRLPEISILPVPGFGSPETAASEASAFDNLLEEQIVSDPAENLRDFISAHQRIIFVPGDLDLHRHPSALFTVLVRVLEDFPGTALLLGGGWGDLRTLKRRELMGLFDDAGLGARVFISGPLTEAMERLCLRSATVVFTASLPPESLELIRVLRGALAAEAVPVMSEPQAHLDSLPWEHRIHAFVATDTPSGWGAALSEALDTHDLLESIRSLLPEFARLQALDQPSNVMSRLYTRLLDRGQR